MQDFNNKVVVVTGGASGVGRAISELLASEGAKIVVADVDAAAMDDTVAGIVAKGGEAIAQRTDVTQQDSVNALAEKAFSHFGGVHLVFANAGIGAGEGGNMWEYNANDWQWAFNVNVWGVLHCVNAFMPRLIEQNEEAHFVVTGSGNGAFIMLPDAPIYTTTKAAVQAIVETLYFQVQALNGPVKVSALYPGPHVVDTGIFNSERVRPEDLPAAGEKASGITSVDDMKAMMEQFGMTLQTTSPHEVAEHAIAGIRADKFWIRPTTSETDAKFQARVESVLSGNDPVLPSVG